MTSVVGGFTISLENDCNGTFFQAEDGIRDWSVTGVQTCALPIYDYRVYRFDQRTEKFEQIPAEGEEIGRASCRERV